MHAPGERHRGLPAAQGLARQVDGHQRGRLAGVHGQGGAAQAEGVGDAVGDQAAVQAGERVPCERSRATCVQQVGVVVRDRPHEDTRVAVAQVRGDHGAVFECLPAELQRQPLLGVHRSSLTGGDAEEGSVEAVDLLEEASKAGARGELVGGRPPRLPPVGRRLRDGTRTLAQQAPEGVRVRGARKAAGDPYYRDRRAVTHGRRPTRPCTRGQTPPTERQQNPCTTTTPFRCSKTGQ